MFPGIQKSFNLSPYYTSSVIQIEIQTHTLELLLAINLACTDNCDLTINLEVLKEIFINYADKIMAFMLYSTHWPSSK